MKSAEEWQLGTRISLDVIRAIQADALRHAAELCIGMQNRISPHAYNMGCKECAAFLEAEAYKFTNEKAQ